MTIQRGRTIVYSDEIVTEQCWVCGVWFGMARTFVKQRDADGLTFYCPNGDKIRYAAAELTALKAELDQARADAAFKRNEIARLERSRSAVKGQLTKARKRAAAALCPVPGCKRQIVQMARHLATVHPEFVADHEDHDHDG